MASIHQLRKNPLSCWVAGGACREVTLFMHAGDGSFICPQFAVHGGMIGPLSVGI